ncbi:MAG TPA: hypothetical protein VJ872_10230, partial [Nocardioides sp.]|nr:hypothetical protein [Nocardioides sp.]
MSKSRNTRRRTEAPAEWQPIGLATPVLTAPPTVDARTLVHDLAVAQARRAARSVITPGVVLAATLGITSYAAASGAMPDATVGASTTATPTASSSTTTTTSTSTTSTTATTPGVPMPGSGGAAGLSSLSGIGGSIPGGNLPVIGKFVANAPAIFSAGLLGGTPAVQTSVDQNQMGHSTGDTTAPGGGDMCDFFLQHMWKNEDGIPVLGSNSHFLTYHTDPAYKNLVLSLASGAIGNSEMPIVNIYQGPLGWIPIFNPTHVRGHGTDYVTLLTGCGGMGLPIDTKTGSVNLDRLPTPAKALNLATRIMPNVPNLSKIMGPDYLYNTLRVDEITNRLGFNTVMTPDEYVAFAGKNFDAFRLVGQTVLEKMNNPASVLDVLKVTDNIKTLQSLGLPGLPGSTGGSTLTGSLPTGGLTAGLPTAGLTDSLPTSSAPVVGPLLANALGGKATPPAGQGLPGTSTSIDTGSTTPVSTTPGSTTPGSTTPGSTTPGNTGSDSSPLGGLTSSIPLLGGGSQGGLVPSGTLPGADLLSSIPVLGGTLSAATGTPAETGTPGSTTPGSTTPGSTTPGSTTPGSTTPGSTTPSGSLPGLDVLNSLPVVGGVLSGSTNSGSTNPGSTNPGSTNPGSTNPGSTNPGSTNPGSTNPGSTNPGSSNPGPAQQPSVAFTVGKPTVNGAGSGLMVDQGSSVTFKVPVTNTGELPL